MSDRPIYLNCDMGEGLQNEAELMPYVQAANIAAGGHAGNADSILEVMQMAKQHQVDIGIHPSYPDRENFGRISMAFDEALFTAAWSFQFTTFLNCSKNLEIEVHHIKPHGALYHDLSKQPELAEFFLQICQYFFPNAKIVGAAESDFLKLAAAKGFEVMREGFADRGYSAEGLLVPRSHPQGIIHEAEAMYQQIAELWFNGKVNTVDESQIDHVVDSICVHGDHPNSLKNLIYCWDQFNKGKKTIGNV